MRNKLVITEFTDPLCNWCYAASPNLRKVLYLNPDIEQHAVLGLMIQDYHKLTGYGPGAEERFREIMEHMTAHQGEVPALANLPHSAKAFAEMQPENMSSYPASVAVEAMKLLDEESANLYIRRIREALHSDGKQITEESVLLDLARELPVDQDRFKELFTNGTAKQALEEDIRRTRELGVQGFPTYLITYGQKHDVFSGYLPYPEFARRLKQLTDDDIILQEKPFTRRNVLGFVQQFGRVAKGEIGLTFNVSEDETEKMVQKLQNEGGITVEYSDHSYFVRYVDKKAKPLHFCDPETGICSFSW